MLFMDYLTTIMKPVTSELEDFKRLFDESLTSSNPLLHEVIAHIRRKNGKMMRPILLLLVARLCGGINASSLHAAVSLELLHTASLVHDDVVDESAERRGQLSVNAVFNNKVAVLSGDYLLATALVQVELTHDHRIVEVVARLGQHLAEGELLQLSNVNNFDFSETVYFDVIRKKTAALFAACTQAAALSAGADDATVERARQLGEYIGICFQIKDDIFDYYDNADIGKPTGNDMHEGKLTLPVLYVLNQAADCFVRDLAMRVKQGQASADDIAQLVRYTKENGGMEYATQVMYGYRDRAIDLLAGVADADLKQALTAYLNYVVEREK